MTAFNGGLNRHSLNKKAFQFRSTSIKEDGMQRFVVAAALLAFSYPVLAAEYYLVKDPATQVCSTTTKKPDGTTLVMVGTSAYATKDKAKDAKKTAIKAGECKKGEKKSDGEKNSDTQKGDGGQ
jgi:hypothetical protein